MSRSYGTRFRGTKVPSTVALENENNDLVSDEEELEREENEEAGRVSRRRGGLGRRYVAEEEEEEYVEGEDEDEDEDEEFDSDDEIKFLGRGNARAGGSSHRAAGDGSSSSNPFAALEQLSWQSAVMPPQPSIGPDGIAQVHESTLLPAPASLRYGLRIGNAPIIAGSSVDEEDEEDMDDEDEDMKLPGGLSVGDYPGQDDPNNRRNTWTGEEDKVLGQLVTRFGAKKWGVIASHLPGRNAKQCHQRSVSQ